MAEIDGYEVPDRCRNCETLHSMLGSMSLSMDFLARETGYKIEQIEKEGAETIDNRGEFILNESQKIRIEEQFDRHSEIATPVEDFIRKLLREIARRSPGTADPEADHLMPCRLLNNPNKNE